MIEEQFWCRRRSQHVAPKWKVDPTLISRLFWLQQLFNFCLSPQSNNRWQRLENMTAAVLITFNHNILWITIILVIIKIVKQINNKKCWFIISMFFKVYKYISIGYLSGTITNDQVMAVLWCDWLDVGSFCEVNYIYIYYYIIYP